MKQSVNQSVNQPIRQAVSQSINQAIEYTGKHRPGTSHPISRPAGERRPGGPSAGRGAAGRAAGGRAGRRGPGGGGRAAGVCGPKNRVPGNTRFSRLILSRAGQTAVRDKINLEKWFSIWAPLHLLSECCRPTFLDTSPAAGGSLSAAAGRRRHLCKPAPRPFGFTHQPTRPLLSLNHPHFHARASSSSQREGARGPVPCGARRNRTVEGGARRSVFVTGAPVKAVARHKAARSGRKRPFHDAKRGGPG